MSEFERLAFVTHRDGPEAALAFARQTLFVYRTCLFRSRKRGFSFPHHASLPEYRRAFVQSCLELRNYLKGQRWKISIP